MTERKPTCFIIQPFDKGEFDELYDDVIEIAVKDANANCLRSDKILGAKPPLDKIKDSIESASICIAEVTLDNPNVFFEAGWAFALNKPIFILWDESKRPDGLPFDIHGKAGIPYNSQKNGWRKELRIKLLDNIKFELTTTSQSSGKHVITKHNAFELNEINLSILGALLKAKSRQQEIGVTYLNRLLISVCGYQAEKVTLAIEKLLRAKLIDRTYNSNGDAVCEFYLNSAGSQLIEENYDRIEPILTKLPEDYSSFAPENPWI